MQVEFPAFLTLAWITLEPIIEKVIDIIETVLKRQIHWYLNQNWVRVCISKLDIFFGHPLVSMFSVCRNMTKNIRSYIFSVEIYSLSLQPHSKHVTKNGKRKDRNLYEFNNIHLVISSLITIIIIIYDKKVASKLAPIITLIGTSGLRR